MNGLPAVFDETLFLPEPMARPVRYTVISVDDHVVEPLHTFEGRLPARLQARAPKIVETRKGHKAWEFEGRRYTQIGMVEVDYPHGDTTWPNTQEAIEQTWGHLPVDELRAMCSENAAALYRHPLPDPVLPLSDSAVAGRRR